MKTPKTCCPKNQKIPKTCCQTIHKDLTDMGLCGSIWVHVKTGKSYLAQDHFWTPPDPHRPCFRGAPGMGEAVVQMCAWGLFALYTYTSASPFFYCVQSQQMPVHVHARPRRHITQKPRAPPRHPPRIGGEIIYYIL